MMVLRLFFHGERDVIVPMLSSKLRKMQCVRLSSTVFTMVIAVVTSDRY